MKNKGIRALLFLGIILLICSGCGENVPLNEIPMYAGKHSPELQTIHDKFIKQTIKDTGSREKAIEFGLNWAWGCYHDKDFKTAMKRFNQVWLLDNNNAEVYWGFGLLLKEKGQLNEALKMYNKAIELDPNMAEVYNNRGNIYKDRKQVELALSDFAKAISLKPDFPFSYMNRGQLYFNMGQYDKALADLNKAIEIVPTDAQSYNDRGCIYFAIKDYNKAWEDVCKAETLGYNVHPEFLRTLKKVLGKEN